MMDLIFVVFHVHRISKLRDLGEELFALLLLDLEFSILHVHVEDAPDVVILKLRNQLIHFVSSDERNVTALASKEFQGFVDLVLDVSLST